MRLSHWVKKETGVIHPLLLHLKSPCQLGPGSSNNWEFGKTDERQEGIEVTPNRLASALNHYARKRAGGQKAKWVSLWGLVLFAIGV